MQKTEHYQLNQWEKTDRIMMEDFNADNAKIDAALASVAAAAGNCKIVTGSYVGTGKYGSANPNKITYDTKPLFIIMNVGEHATYNDVPKVYFFYQDVTQASSRGDNALLNLTWNDTYVSWYFPGNSNQARNQFNTSGTTYSYIMFFA